MKITIQRTGALGDVLCVTPVLREYRRRYPGAVIDIVTACPDAIRGNRDLITSNVEQTNDDISISLDLAYERRPSMHVVDAYFKQAFGSADASDKTLSLYHAPRWTNPKAVIIHAAKSWASRTLPAAYWAGVSRGIKAMGLNPVFVGGGRDYGGSLFTTNMLGRLTLAEVGSLIAGAALFIGSDSSLIHVAGTTETPIVGLYTSVRAKYRMPYRHGVLGWNMIGLEADVPCVGCLERVSVPATDLHCAIGTNECVRAIPLEATLDAVGQLLSRAIHQPPLLRSSPSEDGADATPLIKLTSAPF